MTADQTTGGAEDHPRTVAEVLERITRERAALAQEVVGMSDDALVATAGGWSAKDHLAHAAARSRAGSYRAVPRVAKPSFMRLGVGVSVVGSLLRFETRSRSLHG